MTRKQGFSLNLGWKALLKDMGFNPGHVLRRASLPEDLLNRGDISLSSEAYFRFWRSLEVESGDALFPLQIVQTVSAESFDPPLFAALCSANLMQAVQRLAKYKQLLAPMRLDIDISQTGELTVSPRWLTPPADVPDSLQLAELAFFLQLARLATREPVKAVRVVLPFHLPPPAARRCQAFFSVAMEYGPGLGISFSASTALQPFLTVNDGMWKVFEPDLRRRLSQLDGNASTRERVHALLLELLPGNAATVERVAERLAMSKRTLQRRLEEEGVSFRSLINSTRESLARHYLGSTSMSGGEIAFLLGFEDPNSFYRAFQDWTGQTADDVRHRLRQH